MMRLLRTTAIAPASEEAKLASTQQPSFLSIACELIRNLKMSSRNGELISARVYSPYSSPKTFPMILRVSPFSSVSLDSRPCMSAVRTSSFSKNHPMHSCRLTLES